MSFELHLTISGLCLFARDATAKQMHILVPATDKEFTGCDGTPAYVPTHIAWLLYDRQYEVGGSAGKQMVAVPLDGIAQVVGDGTSSAVTQLPVEVADLGVAAGATVPAKYITMPVARPLAARLTLAAGEAVGCVPGVRWDFGDRPDGELSPGVRWTIANIAGSTLGLNTAHGYKILNAVNHVIDVSIYCVPPTNLPGMEMPPAPPPPNAPPAHFPAFYALCLSSSTPCPKFRPSPDGSGTVDVRGVDPYTCLVSTAPTG